MLSESDSNKVCVIIPAYKPLPQMVDAVQTLSLNRRVAQIIVVDDGSGTASQSLFGSIQGLARVTILRHAVNLGKGQALKTAFNHVLLHHPNAAGVVCADADGQHLTADILKVADCFLAEPASLVLGVRSFSGTVPWRCRFGNRLTTCVFGLLASKRISDTQTGLRGIPAALLPSLLQLRSMRYEFEMEMLILAIRQNVSIREVPINTVYLDGNRSSRFNPWRDSVAIYRLLFRHSTSLMVRPASGEGRGR
jgi:glycosyltransferase involved in cell wall biosynthesis